MFVSMHEPGQVRKTAATRRYGEERRAQVQKLLLGNAHLAERRGRMERLAAAAAHKPFERKRRQTCIGKLCRGNRKGDDYVADTIARSTVARGRSCVAA